MAAARVPGLGRRYKGSGRLVRLQPWSQVAGFGCRSGTSGSTYPSCQGPHRQCLRRVLPRQHLLRCGYLHEACVLQLWRRLRSLSLLYLSLRRLPDGLYVSERFFFRLSVHNLPCWQVFRPYPPRLAEPQPTALPDLPSWYLQSRKWRQSVQHVCCRLYPELDYWSLRRVPCGQILFTRRCHMQQVLSRLLQWRNWCGALQRCTNWKLCGRPRSDGVYAVPSRPVPG